MKNKLSFFILSFFLCAITFGQINNYRYQRTITGIKDQWHKIELPVEIFSKIKPDFSDIRIIGLTKENDTLEVPYIINEGSEKVSAKKMDFSLLNQSKNENGFFYTYELTNESTINQLTLDFSEKNFDWRVSLQGSQNQDEWFSILEDYRVLAIDNELTRFSFTKLIFPNSRYRYYRLHIDTKNKPNLISTTLSMNDTIQGKFRLYEKTKTLVSEEKALKQTIIDIDLQLPVPVSMLTFFIKDTIDYFRPITIKYLQDSTKSQDGWNYIYSTLQAGTLNSFEKNKFHLNNIVLKKIKLIIENDDNRPLQIDSVRIEGNVYSLEARFDKPAKYFLLYGNTDASKPKYDITRFTEKIPSSLTLVETGDEEMKNKIGISEKAPLFENKMWLWLIMTITIIILGWFSFKMMQEKK